MLEALEQVRKVEEENEKYARTLRQQSKTYVEEKERELEIIQMNSRQRLKQLTEEREQFEKQELERERIKLKAEADEMQATLKDQHQKHQSQTIGAIIEKVKKTCGRH